MISSQPKDYLFKNIKIEKRQTGFWLISMMEQAGWVQVGSNAPINMDDTSQSRFFVMKTVYKGEAHYVAINEGRMRWGSGATYGNRIAIVPLVDYVPGDPGTNGTCSNTGAMVLAAVNGASSQNTSYCLFGDASSSGLSDDIISIDYCITPTSVTLFSRNIVDGYATTSRMIHIGFLEDALADKPKKRLVCLGDSGTNTHVTPSAFTADTQSGIPERGSTSPVLLNIRASDPSAYSTADLSGLYGAYPVFLLSLDESNIGVRGTIPQFAALIGSNLSRLSDRSVVLIGGIKYRVAVRALPTSAVGSSGVGAYRIE